MIAHASGVVFDTSPLRYYIQYLDIELLRNNLLESVWYMHMQPPLFNLFLGWVLQLFPASYPTAFNALYAILGLVVTYFLYATAREASVRPWLAFTITALFVLAPSTIYIEHWLFYALPEAALALAGVYTWFRYLRTERLLYLHTFFTLLAILALTRSLFHLVWLIGIAGLVILHQRGKRRGVITAAMVPILIVLAFYAKNELVFDRFSLNSWTGMNLWRAASIGVPEPTRKQLVADGELSRVSLIPPFEAFVSYPEFEQTQPTGIEALDRPYRTTDSRNLNHRAFLSIEPQYRRDALTLIEQYPDTYLRNVMKSTLQFMHPPSDNWAFDTNRAHLPAWEKAYNAVVYGRFKQPEDPGAKAKGGLLMDVGSPWELPLFSILLIPLTIVLALARYARDPGSRTWLSIPLATILWVFAIGNLLDVGENNRFQFAVQPLLLIVAAFLLSNRPDPKTH